MSKARVTGTREQRKVAPAYTDHAEGSDFEAGWVDDLTASEREALEKSGRIEPSGNGAPSREADQAADEVEDGLHYLRHADKQAAAAAAEWQKHLEGLSEQERLDYESRGLIEKPARKAKPERKGWSRLSHSEEKSFLREATDEVPDASDPVGVMAREEARAEAPLAATRIILSEIIHDPRPRLVASLIALALGIGAEQGIDETAIVWHFKVTIIHVLSEVCRWKKLLADNPGDLALPRYVVAQILDDPRPRLQADTFALAFSFPLRQGMSERRLATHYGLTVATLSARVLWWVDHMQARLPSVCKRNTTNYRTHNVRRAPKDPFCKTK